MDYFVIDREMTISFPAEVSHPVLGEILNNYTYGLPWTIVRDHDGYVITSGDFTPVELGENEFALNITPSGVYIAGTGYSALMRGYMTFLEKIVCYDQLLYKAECCTVFGHPEIGVRMNTHIAVAAIPTSASSRAAPYHAAGVSGSRALFPFLPRMRGRIVFPAVV